MERLNKLLLILFLFGSMIPAWYINRWLQKVIKPREAFWRLMVYLLLAFLLVFAYSFTVVLIISRLFPRAKV